MKRETGYYWVKMRDFTWYITLWVNSPKFINQGIFLIGSREVHESQITEINETRIKNPDEK